jgi:hypothetical protein
MRYIFLAALASLVVLGTAQEEVLTPDQKASKSRDEAKARRTMTAE